MRIINITYRLRRDFDADMKCEDCGTVEKNVSCYDDSFFHETVIPKMKCKSCGEASIKITSLPSQHDSVVL